MTVEQRLVKLKNIKFLHELVDYLHADKTYDVRKYVQEQISKTVDNNKGHFWEEVLQKAMRKHTTLLGGNARGRDFTDNSDAKIGVFYRCMDRNGIRNKWEVSIGGIQNKIGPLRVCLVVPGDNYHKVFFLFIPHEAYQKYKDGSDALKFGLSPSGKPTSPLMDRYQVSFEKVCQKFTI